METLRTLTNRSTLTRLAIMFAIAIGAFFMFAPQVSAQNTSEVRRGCQLTGTCTGGEANLTAVITDVVDILSLVVGAVSVIMIIIGGLRYITSGGDSGKVSGAKGTITYAIVGLLVVVFAQVIVNFVITESTT